MAKTAGVLGWIKDAFVQNIGLKVVSLLFSLGLYAFVNGPEDARRSFSLPLVVLPPRQDLNRVLLTKTPSTVNITLRGASSIIHGLRGDDLGKVELDLRSGTGDHRDFNITNLRVPAGVKLSLQPKGVDLRWDDLITRTVPIQVTTGGDLAPTFKLKGKPTATPREVQVRGPRSKIETFQYVHTVAFDLKDLEAGEYVRLLALAPLSDSDIHYQEGTTRVRLRVEQARKEHTFVKVPIEVVGVRKWKAKPPFVDVKVEGLPSVVKKLRVEQVVPRVNVTGTEEELKKGGSGTFQVQVDLPDVKIQIIPKTIIVKW